MTHIAMSPNAREILSAKSTVTGRQEYLTSTNGVLNINGTIGGVPLPIVGATTGVGVAILDSSGNQISSFGGGTQYAEGVTTSPATGTVALGRYNTSSPTLTNGQLNVPQLDVNGNLKVNIVSGGGSGGTSSSFGSAFPSTGTAVGISNGTNMVAVVQGQTTMSASIPVTLASNQSSLAVTLAAETTKVIGTVNQGTSPWVVSGTVTANAGTNLNTSLLALEGGGNLASIKTDVDNLNLAIGSTTSGQKGNLALTATTTAAPSYTTAQSNPLSTDTSGNLRTSVNNTVTVSGTVTTTPPSNASTNIAQINGVTPLMGNGVTGTGSQRVTIASDNTPFTVNAAQSGSWTSTVTQATAANLNATVVGTGTFATQITSLPALPAGTNVIGHVITDTGSTTVVTGTVATNVSQINGVTPLMGNGVTGTGSQRVTIASDNTAFSVNANQGTAAALTAGWTVINGEQTDTTGTFTNATQTNSVTATNLAGYGNVLISINGTFGTATAIFEGSDDGGTTWYTIGEAARTDTNIVENGYTSLTNTTRAWQTNNPGWDSLRVRSTAVASGTVNVRISPSAAPSAAGATVQLGSALPTGANVIGAVNQGTSPWVTSNATTSVVGNGAAATAQRVTLANDSTGIIATVSAVTAITNALPAGTNLMGKVGIDQTTVGTTNGVSIAQIGATTVVNGGVAGTLAVGGVTANGATKTGNPVRIGAVGHTANPSAVTDGQAVDLMADKLGKQVTVGSIRDLKANQVTTITASTAETTIVTSVTSVFVDMYGLIITNTSATAVNVAIKDATAGTTRFNIAVPAGDTRGFMLPEGGAIKQAAVTNNWTATVSASVTSIIITALTVQNL